jgi:hypothetical protein
MGRESRANRGKRKPDVVKTAEQALRDVNARWHRVGITGTDEDGGERDLERGPEEERNVAGERVRLWEDKVFGGRAVEVIRPNDTADGEVVWLLGRVADRDTRSAALVPLLIAQSGQTDRKFTPVGTIPEGVWRNDCNGFVVEQLTADSEDALIERMVRSWHKHAKV